MVPELLVLGPVAIAAGDGRLAVPSSDRQRTLLAVLAARSGRTVTTDELVDALWGEQLPARPGPALQSQVFRLRRLLGDTECISTEAAGYRLSIPAEKLDARRFEDLVARARRAREHDVVAAVELFDEALGLWRGRAYADVADHPDVALEARALDELRLAALEERAAMLLEAGRAQDAATAAGRLIEEAQFREGPVAIRMRALAAIGRHAEAIRTFSGFRRTLGDELGLEPSTELAALEAEILRQDAAKRPVVGLPGNSFVGREVDLAAVTSALAAGRLATLTGPGGIGKTRLALHAAARAADAYPDGVTLVELAAIESGDAVVAAAGGALGIHDGLELHRIIEFLRARSLLLVVDNCEHVLDGVRELVSGVLSRTQNVAVLATSRIRLGVDGEHVVQVGPLTVPDWDDPDASPVALFADRARAVRPGFTLGQATATVAELCRRLEGIPLAIELAAARTVARTPAEILGEVTRDVSGLGDRRRRDARHRSLGTVIDWSYGLLSSGEQEVFACVAVFAGGFTADAAAAVGGHLSPDAVADALTELVEHSLVRAVEVGGVTRFSMLEPIRQHAERRLADTVRLDDVRRRHAVWFAQWIAAADDGLRGADERAWAVAIGHELANLRAAHAWALEHDHAAAARIPGHLYWYAFWYGATEASAWALAALDRGPPPDPAVAATHATAALGAWRSGNRDDARALAHRGIDIAGPGAVEVRFAWEALSSAAVVAGDYAEALRCQAIALDLALRAGDLAHAAREAAARALVLGYLDRQDEAQAELERARMLVEQTSNPTVEAFCAYVGGELLVESDPEGARRELSRAWDAGRMLGNQYLAAIAGLSAVSCTARRAERPTLDLGDFAELLDYFDRTGSVAQEWTVVRSLILLLARIGDDEAAAVLLGALEASTAAAPLIGPDAQRVADVRDALRRRLGDKPFDEATEHGARLGDHEALVLARRRASATRSTPHR